MARTRAEVRAFLNSKVGSVVPTKPSSNLNGQCVTLIKALMEYLGAPNPYAARGNAKDAGTNYINQGIGTSGKGWLTICVNPSMGGGYGHIWVDLAGEANYESNGAKALRTTKNTRPISQARQFVNFDKWIKEPTQGGSNVADKANLNTARILSAAILHRDYNAVHQGKTDSDLNTNHVNKDLTNGYIFNLFSSPEAQAGEALEQKQIAFWNKYNKLVGELEARPTKAQLEEVVAKLAAESEKVAKAEAALKEAQDKASEQQPVDEKAVVEGFFKRIWNSLFKKG